MNAIKAFFMACGVMALLLTVGCVGIVGIGSLAVNEVMNDTPAFESERYGGESGQRRSQQYGEDPFGEYDGGRIDDNKGRVGG